MVLTLRIGWGASFDGGVRIALALAPALAQGWEQRPCPPMCGCLCGCVCDRSLPSVPFGPPRWRGSEFRNFGTYRTRTKAIRFRFRFRFQLASPPLADKSGLSRFPLEVRACMHGVSDRAGLGCAS